MNQLFTFFTLALLAITGAIFWLMPALSRPSIFFAVTVNPSFRETGEARAIISSFRKQAVLLTLVLCVLVAGLTWMANAGAGQNQFTIIVIINEVAIFAQLAASFVFFLKARRRVLPYSVAPSTVREAAIQSETPRSHHILNVLWFGPFLLIMICVLYLQWRWPEVPSRWPVHWNARGTLDGWATKSPLALGWPLIVSGIIAVFMAALSYWVIRRARRVSVSGLAGLNEERARAAQEAFLLGFAYLFLFIMAPISVWLPFRGSQAGPTGLIIMVFCMILAWLALIVVVMAWINKKYKNSHAVGDKTEDRCWKWGGSIYYNPEDPAVWVEKRFGIGWTLNFAHPSAWVVLGILILPSILIAVLVIFANR